MKERWKKIRTGLAVVLLTGIGVFEYIQLMQSFDLPQVILVMPVVGALAFILLRKWGFLVPALTAAFSCLYQIAAGKANVLAELQTNAKSVILILLECLLPLLVFTLLGIGGGALVRILLNRNASLAVGIVCCVLGLVVTTAPYLALYHNPLYPVVARIRLKQYAEEHYTDYAIASKKVYYSLADVDYVCRVSMADGTIRVVYYDSARSQCFDKNT